MYEKALRESTDDQKYGVECLTVRIRDSVWAITLDHRMRRRLRSQRAADRGKPRDRLQASDVTFDLINGLYIGRVLFDFERRELGLGSPFNVKCAVYAATVDGLERVCALYHEAARLQKLEKSVTVGVQSNWVVSSPFPCGDREVEAAVKVVIEDVRKTMITESRTKNLNSCVVKQLDTSIRRGRTSVDSFVTTYAQVL